MVGTAPARVVPPGPPGVPVLGNLLEIGRDQLGFYDDIAARYGDVVLTHFGRRPVVMLNNPDDVEYVLVKNQRNFVKGTFYRILGHVLGEGLLTSDGQFWKRQRHLAQPAFHHERIDAYAETMVDFVGQTTASWCDGDERDLHTELMRLTLRVVASTLFDADIEGGARAIGDALPRALAEANAQMIGPEFLLPDQVPTPSRHRLNRAVAELDTVVYRMIDERRASGEDHGDLLSALLAARDEDGRGMSRRHLRDEAMTIILAGHETTAIALTWALVLLDQNPEVRGRLEREVDRGLAGNRPTLIDVRRLPYAEAVLLEAMRLYPPIYGIGRQVVERCEIGGYVLEPGTSISIAPWVIQRDSRWFDDPLAFRPERWLDGLAKRLPRFAYFPFGGGPRLCIGQQFAMLEGELLLSSIVQGWRLRLVPGQDLAPHPALTMRPRHGIRMTLGARV